MTALLAFDDWADRLAEIEFVVDHLDDLHADFLAIWGIDLDRDEPPPAARFFAMCRRTFAFDGVMAARLAALDRDQPPRTTSRPSTPAAPARTTAPAGRVQEVSLDQLRRMHPDLIDH